MMGVLIGPVATVEKAGSFVIVEIDPSSIRDALGEVMEDQDDPKGEALDIYEFLGTQKFPEYVMLARIARPM